MSEVEESEFHTIRKRDFHNMNYVHLGCKEKIDGDLCC